MAAQLRLAGYEVVKRPPLTEELRASFKFAIDALVADIEVMEPKIAGLRIAVATLKENCAVSGHALAPGPRDSLRCVRCGTYV
jgi:hypothetical protein